MMRIGSVSRGLIGTFVVVAIVATIFISRIAFASNTHSVDLEKDSQQYLSIADGSQTGLDVTGNLTLEAWVKVESTPSGEDYVIAGKDGDSGGTNRGYAFVYRDTGSGIALTLVLSPNGTSNQFYNATQTLTPGVWYHVAVAWTAASHSATFYVDGSSIGTDSSQTATSTYNNTAPFVIGSQLAGTVNWFDGKIDEVRVWNVVRTGQEISDNKSTDLNGNESGLVGYWKLNSSLADSTANGNTLSNPNSAVYSTDTESTLHEVERYGDTTHQSIGASALLRAS